MKRKVLAMFLCISMMISATACGKKEAEEPKVKVEHAAAVDNGTLKEDSATIAVGQTTVPYNEYKVYYYFMKNQYEDTLTPEVWNYTGAGEEGKTIGQEAIEDVLRLIIQVKVIGKAAAAQGVTLAADEKEEADYNATTFCESLSEEEKQANSITPTLLAKIFEENKLAEKMYHVITGQVDVNITPEQSQASRVQMLYLKADESNKEQVKQQMDGLATQAQSSKDSFYAFAKANTQASEVECLIGRLDERTNLLNAVMSMKKGQVSSVIEEKDGYYIVYVLEESNQTINEEYKNEVVAKRQTEAFQKAYKTWSEQYEVEVSKSLLIK